MKANNRILILREATKKITRILAGRDIIVTQRGIDAYTESDPRTNKIVRINIPYIPDDASNELINAIQGYLDHEVAHVLFSDFSIIKEAHRMGVAKIHNIVEDAFIESKMKERFYGSEYNLDSTAKFYTGKLTQKLSAAVAEGDQNKILGVLFISMVRCWRGGHAAFEAFMEDKWSLVQSTVDKLPKDIIDGVRTADSSQDTLDVAVKIKKFFDDLNKKQNEPKQEQQPKQEPQKQPKQESEDEENQDQEEGSDETGEDSEGGDQGNQEEGHEESGADEETDEPDKDKDEGENGLNSKDTKEEDGADEEHKEGEDEKEDEAAGSGKAGEDGDGEDEEEEGDSSDGDGGDNENEEPDRDSNADESDSNKGDSEDDGNGEPEESEEPGDGNDASGNSPAEPDGEEEEPIDVGKVEDAMDAGYNEAISAEIRRKSIHDMQFSPYVVFTTDHDTLEVPNFRLDHSRIARMEEEVNHTIGPMQKEIERSIIARSYSRNVPGYRSGKLNTAGLMKLAIGSRHPNLIDDRVFRKKEIHESKDVAVMLMPDLSGSMAGDKVRTATYAAFGLATTLARLNIACEVIGYTTGGVMPNSALMQMERDKRSGIRYDRFERLYMPILKTFDESMSFAVKNRFAMARTEVSLRNNIDGECIQVGARRLAQRKEKGKIMIVLSDGDPIGGGGRAASEKLKGHCKTVVKQVMESGVSVIGIGIESNSVRHYYPHHIVINRVDDLPKAIMNTLKQMIMAQSY